MIYCYHYETYCNYIVTILISIIYHYLYRYILSIKIYNNQFRYKHTDSIIGMIINNTEINNHTVYSYHIYTTINTILVYSNFFSVYHSYLLSFTQLSILYLIRHTRYSHIQYNYIDIQILLSL